jgi:hypothetical protein
VYNLLGQMIRQGRANASQLELNLTDHSTGVYVLKITDVRNNKSENFKLIKK